MCCPAISRVAFFMYLIKLYRRNKFWFVVVLLFAAGQLFINYKNGVMCSPFFNYDMYSHVSLPHRQYRVVEVRIDNRLLQTKDFSANEWDNLIQPVVFFEKQENWNRYIFQTETQKFLPIHDSLPYINGVTENTFKSWYAKQVNLIAGSAANPNAVHVSTDTFLLAQQYLHFK